MIFTWTTAWLITAFLHLGALLLLARGLSHFLQAGPWRERLWIAAILGALVTSTLQTTWAQGPLVSDWLSASATADSTQTSLGLATSDEASIPALVGQTDPSTILGSMQPFAAPSSGAQSTAVSFLQLQRLVPLLWIGIALFLIARMTLRRVGFRKSLRRKILRPSHEAYARLRSLLPRKHAASPPRLSISPTASSPLVLAGGEICFPEAALEDWSDRELRATLAHECAHIERRDPLRMSLQGLLESLFFFQPLLRMANRALRAEAEFACDDRAIRSGADPLGLARSLAHIAAWQPSEPLGVAARMAGESGLVTRVARLTTDERAPSSPGRNGLAASALGLGLLLFACGGPGMSGNSNVEIRETPAVESSHSDRVVIVIPRNDLLEFDGQSYRVPDEWSRFHDDLAQRGAKPAGDTGSENSDLRVVIDVLPGVTFKPVQKLMEHLARARVWRIAFAMGEERTLAVPLLTEADDLIAPVEEILEEDDLIVAEIQPARAGRAEIKVEVITHAPRKLRFHLDAQRFEDLQSLGEGLEQTHRNSPIRLLVIDARAGVIYQDVVSLLDEVIEADLKAKIVFVGAYGD